MTDGPKALSPVSTGSSPWNWCASPSAPRSPPPGCAAAATRRLPTRPRSTPCAQELNRLPSTGTVVIGEGERDEAPMLYIGEEVGTRRRPGGRYRARSARRHDDLRQEPAERAGRHRRSRKRAACSSRRTSTWTRSRSVRAIRTASIDIDASPAENIANLAKAKGVPVSRDHRLHPRPAAPCQADRGGARDRRRDPPDRRRRRRRHHPHDRPGRDRHRHLSRHRRRARRRAGGGGAALHRRPDAGPAAPRHAGKGGARGQDGHHRSRQGLPDRGHGARRRAVRGDRRHRRQPAGRRAASAAIPITTHTIVLRSSSRTVREIKARHQDLEKF